MRGRTLVAAGLVGLSGCVLGTGPEGPFAQVTGTWAYTGAQSASSLTLAGTLTISDQEGDLMTGSLSFVESDGAGGTRADGGAVTGRVLEMTDVDFDVLLATGDRRHVAHISVNGDTLSGLWSESGSGATGSFKAVRN